LLKEELPVSAESLSQRPWEEVMARGIRPSEVVLTTNGTVRLITPGPLAGVATIPGVRYLGPSTTFGSHEEGKALSIPTNVPSGEAFQVIFDPKTSTLLETRIVVVCERRSNSLAGDKDAGVIPYRHAAVIP
jgi:hypothetical protein